ncbi:unnamed protein product [Protopolystoma xenopodis]|uniref:Uncharacterized protein n=1 Tax=Protopolystoma xenopodis TaxID=117903 RepID=A0A448X045_9PLAT|nr:unnamed protein product [Protopolystoma xenopodis]
MYSFCRDGSSKRCRSQNSRKGSINKCVVRGGGTGRREFWSVESAVVADLKGQDPPASLVWPTNAVNQDAGGVN